MCIEYGVKSETIDQFHAMKLVPTSRCSTIGLLVDGEGPQKQYPTSGGWR